MVGSYPSNDPTTDDGRALQAALERFDIAYDITIYPGARHSFCNDERGAYNAAAAEDAWHRTLAFFNQHMRGTTAQGAPS